MNYALILIAIALGSCTVEEQLPSTDSKTPNELYRMTPRQADLTVLRTMNHEYGWRDHWGEYYSWVVYVYSGELGGINFLTTTERDHTAKVQTVLTTRLIAWQVAAEVVDREFNQEKVIFDKADLNDYPLLSGEEANEENLSRDRRWTEQIEEFFWRFYSRPATDEEVAAIRSSFITIIQAESFNMYWTWIATVYSIIATEEFWNI